MRTYHNSWFLNRCFAFSLFHLRNFTNKIASNGGSKIDFYLIKQVDELLLSDSALELPRLSHPKKDRFNLLRSVWANKGYARYWTDNELGTRKAGAYYVRLSRAAVSSTVANRSLRICSSCARFASASLSFPYPPFGFGALCDVVAAGSSISTNRYERQTVFCRSAEIHLSLNIQLYKLSPSLYDRLYQVLPFFPFIFTLLPPPKFEYFFVYAAAVNTWYRSIFTLWSTSFHFNSTRRGGRYRVNIWPRRVEVYAVASQVAKFKVDKSF